MKPTEFLEKFFAGTTHKIELRTFALSVNGKPGGIRDRVFSRDMAELAAFIDGKLAKRETVYYGICTRDGIQHSKKGGLGTKENCREITAFWCDLDEKSSEAFAKINALSPPVSLVLDSGGGYHAYWLLQSPADAQDRRIEPILKSLAVALGADEHCAQLACVLRPPGTLNFKPEFSEPPVVKIVQQDWTRRYAIDDFAAFAGRNGTPKAPAATEGRIPIGKRYDWLLSQAGSYRRRGDNESQILEKLKIDFLNRCENDGSVDEAQLRPIAKGVCKYEPPAPPTTLTSEIELARATAIKPELIVWLWPYRIPLGKLSVFCGVPDVGKSVISTDVAARGTKGTEWPDCENTNEAFDVLMLVSEDDLADTVVPRLIAADADLNRVHFAKQTIVSDGAKKIERRIAFDADLAAIEQLLERNKQIRLVIVDPLASYLGKMKKNDEECIRWVLTSLADIAARRNVAILTIDHFNKNIQQSAIHRLSGAGALAAVPRAVWGFVKDANDENKTTRLMLNAKGNVIAEAKKAGLKYRIVSTAVIIAETASDQPKIEWGGKTETALEDVLQKDTDPRERREAKARRFLASYLKDGPRPSTEIEDAARQQGISRQAVWEAKKTLNIKPTKSGFTGAWYWELYDGGAS